MKDSGQSPEGVTMRDVADHCGVAVATVSRALRDHPRISDATKLRVLQAAQELGFRPDARLGELMGQVRQGRKAHYQGHIALVFPSGRRADRENRPAIAGGVGGVNERAEQLGYGVAEFWLEDDEISPSKLGRALKTRDIRGVILIQPGPEGISHFELDWSVAAWVTLGFVSPRPGLHAVTSDRMSDAMEAVYRLHDSGARRVVYIYEVSDAVMGNDWLAGYSAGMITRDLEPLVVKISDRDFEGFAERVARRDPEAVLTHSHHVEKLLREADFDCPMAFLNLMGPDPDRMGIRISNTDTGVNAVDLVVSQLRQGEHGLPSVQKKVITRGSWHCPEDGARVHERDGESVSSDAAVS